MGRQANGGWTTETLGDLIDQGEGLHVYCSKCERALECDVYDLTIWLGRRYRFICAQLPLRCMRCGSKETHFTVTSETRSLALARTLPPENFRRSRTTEERVALMAVFPRTRV